jgi:uncharacterized protein (TIGR02680 family)
MTVMELRPAKAARRPDEPLRADRWRPTRAGILNVWRYYDEVFTFHQGRLLLRGANGTGKSKALELLLPYLLDASLQPTRLSTFGGSERTMHWNLMGDGYPNTTRVGYVWLEFGRSDPDGTPQYLTCGARLSATAHSKKVSPVYFTTRLRIGQPGGVRLVKDGNVPLSKAELEAALAGAGTVHESPAAYRRTIRETLLRGVTDDQYGALINALLKLRTPKLSEHLDPEHLSKLLSDALPPLDQQDLAEIAEGFEKLDRQREDLAQLDNEVDAAERLADKQRRYARRALRRAAADLISATTQLDNLAREARASRVAHEQAVAEAERVSERLDEIDRLVADAKHRIDGLTDSDAYRHGRELDKLREAERAARQAATTARNAAARRAQDAHADEEKATASRNDVAIAHGVAERSHAEARRLAVQSGLAMLFEPLAGTTPRQARLELRGIVEAREHQIAEVRAALDAHENAVAERKRTEGQLARRTTELEQRLTEVSDRSAERDAARQALREAIAGWAGGLRILPLAEQAEQLAELAGDEPALVAVVGQAATTVREGLAREEQRLTAEKSAVEDEWRRRREEQATLQVATTLEPEPPPHRTADRSRASGAPLWRLVDWQPGIDDQTQTAVEAALQAAGVLDAWLYPDGEVRVHGAGHDTYLAAALARPAPGRSLADLLVSGVDGAVPAAVVRRVLAGIGFGPTAPDHVAAVGADGTWRLGPAHGSWRKAEAAYLGATARERARQRRLAELAELISELETQIAGLAAGLAEIGARRAALAAELDGRPPHDALRDAEQQLAAADLRLGEQRRLVAEAEREQAMADAAAKDRQRALSLTASRHALPTARSSLDELASLLRTFRNTAEGWLADRDRWQAATDRADDLAQTAARSRGIASEAAQAAAEEAQRADGLAARLAAVEAAVDAPYRQILDQIGQLRQESQRLDDERRRLLPTQRELDGRIGRLATQRVVDEDKRNEATKTRDGAAARVIRLGWLGFGRDARLQTDLTELATTTAALDAARQLASELERVGYEQLQIRRAEAELSETMHDVSQHLAGHADLVMEPDEESDVQVVVATIDGQQLCPADLVQRLRAERDQVHTQLTEDERRLFDRTLTGDTRRHVADRIRQADALVREVSAQLEQVRTVSALQVRLTWQVDPDLGPVLRQARDLLLRDPATLTDAEREALYDFFRARIDEVRDAGTAGDWVQQLDEVLDYRRWHRFVVQMRVTGGEWVTVTRRQHGAKSGGEKAIVLHLPLFAAAAAHYRSAPEAPRLILLDEVFVGVDSTNRGQLMEVLAAFDLDLLLTSDTEWCTYPELDGIAIHQLLVGDDDDAVTTARFVWDGARLAPADQDAQADQEEVGFPQ